MSKAIIAQEFENIGNQFASMCSSIESIKDELRELFDTRMENMFELGRATESIMRTHDIDCDDRYELFLFCSNISEDFERQFDSNNQEYYMELTKIAEKKILEILAPEKLSQPKFIPKDVKDMEAYEADYHKTCYIPENADSEKDHYSHSQLLALVHGDERLCRQLFDCLTWQFPETAIIELLEGECWGKCESCGRYYDITNEEMVECPHCHTLFPGDENPMEAFKAAIEKGE